VRAILEANASLALWMQWLILQVLKLTRAATSIGPDLDTWWADFTFARNPATYATGLVTYSRSQTTASALIPAPFGFSTATATVKTLDGSVSFVVTADGTNSAWSPSLAGYVMAPGVASVTVPVIAVTPGIIGNVVAGAIGLIAGAGLAGVDSVANAAGFTNGLDAETDPAGRARFQNFINTRSRATVSAVAYAVQSVQQGLTYTIAENQNADGSVNMGNFIVTVDDGSGAPSGALLALVTVAVNAVRPVGSRFLVQAPSVVHVAVTFTIVAKAGYVQSTLLAPAVAAVTAFINGLPMGAILPFTRIAQAAYDSVPGIANITNVLVNSATADIGGASAQVVRATSVVAS